MKRQALGFVRKLTKDEARRAPCRMGMREEGVLFNDTCDQPAKFCIRAEWKLKCLCRRHLKMLMRQAQKALEE